MKQLKVINYEGLYNENVARIKTRGFNQWDEQWELGYFNLTTGEPASNSNICRSKNFISVFPSTEYFYKSNNTNHTILYYDIDYNYISNAQFGTSNSIINTPSNCRFIKIAWVGTTYNNDICVNISDSDRNGEYEPYWESETPLFDVTKLKDINGEIIFPYGMISHGDVADELTKTTATSWFEVYNLGDLDWSQDNAAGKYYTTQIRTGLWENDLAVMAKYPRSSTRTPEEKKWGNSGGGSFEIQDSTYQTAAAFKASLANQLLFVVRTSPVVYQLQQPVPIEYRTDESGVEEYTGYNQSKPLTTLINYDAIYDNQFYNTGRSEFADRLGNEYGNISYQELAESFNQMGDALDYAITEIEQLSEQLVELEEIVDRIDVDKFLAKTGGTMSGNISFSDNNGVVFDNSASIYYDTDNAYLVIDAGQDDIHITTEGNIVTGYLYPEGAVTDIGTLTHPYYRIYGGTIYEGGVALSKKYDSWKATTNNVFRFRYLLNLLSGTNFNDIKGSFDTIRGNTVSWNQRAVRRASSSINGITMTYSNGVYSFTGTATATAILSLGYPVLGHKMFININYLNNPDSKYLLQDGYGGFSSSTIYSHGTNSNAYYIVYYSGQTANLSFELDIFDLTQMFGSGNEPSSVSDAKAQWALDYAAKHPEANDGKVLNLLSPEDEEAGIDTVGFNLWDEQWEEVSILSMPSIVSKNIIKVEPNSQYYFWCGKRSDFMAAYGVFVQFYDKSGNIVSAWTRLYNANSSIATPNSAYGMKIGVIISYYGTTYNHDICINLSNTAKNGTYEPHKHAFSRLDLSSIKDSSDNTLFPYGLCGINTVHDEVSKFRAVKRMDRVDLGTLNWNAMSYQGQTLFYANNPTQKLNTTNYLCSKYTTSGGIGSILDKQITGSGGAGNSIWIRDDSYSDVATFKAAMSGVILEYELAEPVIVETDWLQKQDYPAFADGSEEILSDTTMIDADITYSNDVSVVFARVAQVISDGNESMTLSDIQRAVQVLRYI